MVGPTTNAPSIGNIPFAAFLKNSRLVWSSLSLKFFSSSINVNTIKSLSYTYTRSLHPPPQYSAQVKAHCCAHVLVQLLAHV